MAVFRKDSTPASSAAFSAPRGLTAAAAQVKINDRSEVEQFKSRRASAVAQWQQEAWDYYDAIGEIKYAFNLVGAVVSRIRLYAATVIDPSEAPVALKNTDAVDSGLTAAAERALERLDSAYGGQAGLLKDAALNLLVTGECYLVQMPERIGTGVPESWDIRSVDEVRIDQRGQYIITTRRDLNGAMPIVIPNDAFVGRIWRAHPRYSDEPDSSLKGVLDLCAELLLLNRTFRATARSRLNAGALYLPDGLSMAAGTDSDFQFNDEVDITGPTPEEEEDEFEEQLVDAMTTPISDESSASAVVPLIIRGPAELGDKIKQFKFERSFDPALAQRADRVLERILQGLDVPKDTVTGLANVKYSNAIQIDESLYKAHIEPMLLLLSDAITVVYLRPYLKAIGYPAADVDRLVVWYDPSAVSTRNDRAMDADAGFDKMAVSYETWRRAHGFSDADAPSPTEVAIRMMIEKGMITPELTEAMLQTFAPDAMDAVKANGGSSGGMPMSPEIAQALGEGGGPTPTSVDQSFLGEQPPPGLAEPTPETPAPASEEPAPAAEETLQPAGEPPLPLAEPEPTPKSRPRSKA
ncbi:MAG: hypothetical protein EBT15_09750 [Betaproteobacteria bacterium]|nr:hypothetical protein [Betaproteobacteria bacterium]